MRSVLGLDLDTAAALLQAEGKPVRLVEVRSKKGPKGADRRVIKTTETDAEIVLYWSAFRTEVTTPQSPVGDSDGLTWSQRVACTPSAPCSTRASASLHPAPRALGSAPPCTGEPNPKALPVQGRVA
ncbi:MAG: hypothetical protein IKD54_05550, partial [Clostridia bacterium]|nr:hypothetical protein [Clostridia bacterium]